MCERTSDDYWRDTTPPSVGRHANLALVQAGLAVPETRGGLHGTDRGREVLNALYRQLYK